MDLFTLGAGCQCHFSQKQLDKGGNSGDTSDTSNGAGLRCGALLPWFLLAQCWDLWGAVKPQPNFNTDATSNRAPSIGDSISLQLFSFVH